MLSSIFDIKRLRKEKELHPNLFRQRILAMVLFVAIAVMILTGSPLLLKMSHTLSISYAMTSLLCYMAISTYIMFINYKSRNLLENK